ncbi:MAG: phosphate-starvation-inducible PsiE family protein [Methanospirillum sp.]
MLQNIERFERGVYTVLLLLLFVLITFAVITLVAAMAADILSPPMFFLTGDEILNLFGTFLLVLITLEFFESIKVYLRENTIPYELVVVIAITAIARKVIVLDLESASDLHLIGLGVVVIALAGAYYLLKRGGIAGRDTT